MENLNQAQSAHKDGKKLVAQLLAVCRVFQHKWSVNLKFLPEETFRSKEVAIFLLMAHLGLLWLFAQRRWCKDTGGILHLARRFCRAPRQVNSQWL